MLAIARMRARFKNKLVIIRKRYIHRHLLLLQVNSMHISTGRPQSAAYNTLRAAEVVKKAGGGKVPAGGMNQRTTTAGIKEMQRNR